MHKHWISGLNAGQNEVFYKPVPGGAGSLAYSKETNTFWLALVEPPKLVQILKSLAQKDSFRWLFLRLPKKLDKPLPGNGIVVEIGLDGTLKRALYDEGGEVVNGVASV